MSGCDSIVTLDLTLESFDLSTSKDQFEITAMQTGVNYQWIDCDDNDSEIIGETNASYIATFNGSFACVLTDDNCSDTTNCVDITGLDIDGNRLIEFNTYPNPNDGVFYIFSRLKGAKVSIYSLDGKMIIKDKVLLNTNQVFNLKSFERGVYIIEITSDEVRKLCKITIQ
jgi:hypothetical protein